ncbi:hypothetical protein [Flavobacterium sp.]|uniref:hypothetical protein n=1 Tax=Flavobacterium sp. TaxID=239 RepID=UPI00261E5D8E|nr:hypothetical protein [Flavobacterium sp.]MDD2985363.1 hypothetical protein [Flavobacterium sp.]
MKNNLFTLLFLFVFGTTFAQQAEWGSKFDFDAKNELAPKFVLVDNYNYYLLSVLDRIGMMAKSEIILRKFDQKNNLVETTKHALPVLDSGTLHNILGSFAIGNEKAVVFTQSYSNKAKKNDLYKHVLEKSTGKFTSTLIASYPILSAMKSGSVTVKQSDNKMYFVLNYQVHSSKKEPDVNHVKVINGSSLEVEWEKEVTYTDEYYTRDVVATNSGNVVYVRPAYSYKLDNYISLVTKDDQKAMQVGEKIDIHQPKAISIGTQDYLLAFNYPSKGVRRGDYGYLMLYDLSSGSILQNNEIEGFNSVIKIKEVAFRDVIAQNNMLYIFAEAKVDATPKPTPGSTGFPESIFTYGPSFLIMMGNDGKVSKMNPIIASTNNVADLFHAFGVINVKGEYFINTGMYSGLYSWNDIINNKKTVDKVAFGQQKPLGVEGKKIDFINQLMHYYVDRNQFLFALVIDGTQMTIGTFPGLN